MWSEATDSREVGLEGREPTSMDVKRLLLYLHVSIIIRTRTVVDRPRFATGGSVPSYQSCSTPRRQSSWDQGVLGLEGSVGPTNLRPSSVSLSPCTTLQVPTSHYTEARWATTLRPRRVGTERRVKEVDILYLSVRREYLYNSFSVGCVTSFSRRVSSVYYSPVVKVR